MSDTLRALSTPNAFGASRLAQPEPPRAVWGLFNRKERWRLSWRGWLVLASTLLLAGAFLLKTVYPFLATTHRVDADVLVVEGWVHEYAIRAAVEEFRSKSYQRVFTTGGPVEGTGGYINDYNTEASVGAELLIKNGLPLEAVAVVPSRVMNRDRTYGSAIALRNWFHEQNLVVRSLNVLTEDVHARRSRLLFQEALGKDIKVGIIALPNPDYDWRHWWRYSAGVKEVSSETIAYLYAKCLFYPSEPPPVQKAAASDSDTR
jgi:uncharacterized SAM-binding protein YcdF (DUF218 family)